MGIFKAAAGSVGGVMADQWLECYFCDALPEGVLAMRAEKKVSERSSNTKGEENCISDGSLIIVNAGQCAIAIDRGEIIGVYSEQGQNIYHSDRSPSLFHGGGLKGVFRQSMDRFGYGGVAAVYQIIMFLDVREHLGNAFSVRIPMNIRDTAKLVSIDAEVTLSGMFSFHIADPATFYKKVCGNSYSTVMTSTALKQITAELEMLLRQALAKECAREGMNAYDLSLSADSIIGNVGEEVNEQWVRLRGFKFSSIAIDSIDISHHDRSLLQSVEYAKALTDPTLAAATLVGAQAQAMQSAAKNTGFVKPTSFKRESIKNPTMNNKS